MASVNRAALITKIHRILKKTYKPAGAAPKETVLESLLFAAVLENAAPEAAEAAFTTLHERFFDLNEVRVSTIRELAEVMPMLPDPEAAALRVKQVLQSVFESQYSFDLEPLKKQNLGQAVKQLEKYAGVTTFAVAYVTQTALGGHAIPVNSGALQAMLIVGVVSDAEAKQERIPGMERAISKSKGGEFASLLHQLGIALATNPHGPAVRKVLLDIDPDCKPRLPKRSMKKESDESSPPASDASPARPAAKKAEPAPKKAESKPPQKQAAQKNGEKPKSAKKPPTASAAKKPASKKPAAKKKTGGSKKKSAPATSKKKTSPKKGASKRLTKKKPK